MAQVTIDHVFKSYGEGAKRVDILKGVSCTLADGELIVLVGPSGCGKSTLLRMVAGLEDITAGTLSIDGRVVNDVKPADRDIAMVFQSYALYPHLTVEENIAFGLRLRKTPREEEARLVREAAAILGLDELLHRFPKELSGGQRQRVAMGRAIVRKPKVFLFDEPLSNLDAALRGRMRVEIKKLHRRLGVTMIYVTHDQVEAMTLADRIVVLKDGLVQQVGTPRELYDRPANRFVGGFIGTPEMNVFPGTLVRDGGSLAFSLEGGGTLPLAPGVLASDAADGVEALLGLRPADLSLSDGTSPLTGTLEVVEPLGWESLLHLSLAGRPLVVQAETERARRLQPGSEVAITVEPSRAHVFDARTGVRL
jgi:multiple sugar transport system ATP-binding protein